MPSNHITFVMPVTSQPRYFKRIQAFRDCNYNYLAFSFERDYFKGKEDDLSYISLGHIPHRKYLSRIPKLLKALSIIKKHKEQVVASKLIYTFGLDTAVLMCILKKIFGISTPLVYEVADIRSVMLGEGVRSALFRWVERFVCHQAAVITITSPDYGDEYFIKKQNVSPDKLFVLENKLYPPIPEPKEKMLWDGKRPLVLGLFGVLRCQKSWDILYNLAKSNPEKILIYLRGYALGLRSFEERVNELDNIIYEGEYVSPDDLAEIYSRIDISMIGNIGDGSPNFKWALPNRWYESLYYRVPVIAHKGSAVAKRVNSLGCGWVINFENLKDSLEILSSLQPEVVAQATAKCRVEEDEALGLSDHKKLIAVLT